jgi:hypothetical protein
MMDSKVSLEVARALYAQMCHFHEETDQQRLQSDKTTKQTALLVQSIGTLLLIFVVVIAFYITELANQFTYIVSSIEQMNEKAITISKQMSGMKNDMVQVNEHVLHMDKVLTNMRSINHHIGAMEQEMGVITEQIVHFDQLGEQAMQLMGSMNKKMSHINQSTSHINLRMYQISKPAKLLPNP